MNAFFTAESTQAVLIQGVLAPSFDQLQSSLSTSERAWIQQNHFSFQEGAHLILPNKDGGIGKVIACFKRIDDVATTALLARRLPTGSYQLVFDQELTDAQWFHHAVYWGLGCYRFSRYLTGSDAAPSPSLVLNQAVNSSYLNHVVDSFYLGQNLINTPTEDMTPQDLVEVSCSLAEQFEARISVIDDQDQLQREFPLVHAVGRASVHPPCLIDLRWGNPASPKVTLVGKGVCYDTGGLSLKPTSNMKAMKKDMGGAASVLALARLIMAEDIDVALRVLIPAVENSVAGNSYRPGDVFTSRSGVSVEITNTDAEGRLILADALTYAQEGDAKPDYLIDFATLTGAARVAMGADVAPVFSSCDQKAQALARMAADCAEDIWPLPAYQPYRSLLKSDIADIANSASSGFGGAITATLFLQEFIEPKQNWWHFDVFCTVSQNWPGLGKGARIPVLLTVFEYLKKQIG